MDTNFPRCMKAGFHVEQDKWELADALLKEADDKFSGPHGLNAVAADFTKIGMDYGSGHLQMLRRAAETPTADLER